MFDPDLKYCPQCGDEYRWEIEKCASCGKTLITGQQRIALDNERRRRYENRPTALSASDDLVNIRQGSLADIKELERLLNAEKIAALIVSDDEDGCGKGCCASTFYLQVRREDAQEAVEVLSADFRKTTALDQHDTTYAGSVFNPMADEAVCPACGYRFSTSSNTCPDCGLCLG